MNTTSRRSAEAQILREYGPATLGDGRVHGVTFDGKLVWFARDAELVAFDPDTESIVRRLDVPAEAGTAFDGEHLYVALWHGVSDDDGPPELRRLAPDGAVEEVWAVSDAKHVSGVESNRNGAFWCGGEGGTLRLVGPRTRKVG